MAWLFFAFSGPVLWAVSTHFDKYLVERYFKHSDVAVLLLFTALCGLLTLPFIAYYERTIFEPSATSIALIILSGVLYMGATLFYLHALQSDEASVVAPFFQTVPLFGYLLAFFVLGERLSGLQVTGGILIVVGTLIVSVRFGQKARRFKLRLVLLMLYCGLVAAVSGLIFKLFAIEVAFWTTTFWMFVGEAIFGVALLCVANYRRQLVDLFRAHAAALLAVNGSNELINLGGGLGNRYALLFAPLSIVQRSARRPRCSFSCSEFCSVSWFRSLAARLVMARFAAERHGGRPRRAGRGAGNPVRCVRVTPAFALHAELVDPARHCGACRQTATSGALAEVTSMPHEACRSSRNVAGLCDGPQ